MFSDIQLVMLENFIYHCILGKVIMPYDFLQKLSFRFYEGIMKKAVTIYMFSIPITSSQQNYGEQEQIVISYR